MKTYEQVAKLTKRSPGLVQKCLELCDRELYYLWQRTGIHFTILAERVPTREELQEKMFFPNLLDLAATHLIEYFHRALQREKQLQEDPLEWKLEDFDTEYRVKLEYIHKTGILDKLQAGLIDKQSIIAYMYDHKHVHQPSRWDFMNSKVILPEDFSRLQKRFGRAVVMRSMPVDHPERTVLLDAQSKIQTAFSHVDQATRVYPAVFKEKYPEAYMLARVLYGSFECALRDIAGHSYRTYSAETKRDAYPLFVRGEDVLKFLEESKVPPKVQDSWIADFKQRMNHFIGHTSNVNTSQLEEIVQKRFEDTGIFYRRQVPYREFTDTYAKYIADFVVDDTVIEVIDDADAFIHTPDYFMRLAEKEKLVIAAGMKFITVKAGNLGSLNALEGIIPNDVFVWPTQSVNYISPSYEFSGDAVSYKPRSIFLSGYSDSMVIHVARKNA